MVFHRMSAAVKCLCRMTEVFKECLQYAIDVVFINARSDVIIVVSRTDRKLYGLFAVWNVWVALTHSLR